jgi:hypothetical protein
MPMRLLATILAVLLARSTHAQTEDGFTPLFPDEAALDAWTVTEWNDISKPVEDSVHWSVVDGVLHGSESRGTWLISKRDYGDFELRYEFRLGELGNSGLALRAPTAGDPAFEGLELQMADDRYNTDAKPSELVGGIYRAIAPRERVYKPTEWNEYQVRLEGDRLHVTLNGTVIHDLSLNDHDERVERHDGSVAPPIKDRPQRGRIGFQELSRGDDRVQIRNVRLRVLDANAE